MLKTLLAATAALALMASPAAAAVHILQYKGTFVAIETIADLPAGLAGLTGTQNAVVGDEFLIFSVYDDIGGQSGGLEFRFDDGSTAKRLYEIAVLQSPTTSAAIFPGNDEVGTSASDGFFIRMDGGAERDLFATFFGVARPTSLSAKTNWIDGTGFGYFAATYSGGKTAWAGLNITSMSLSAAPEPATWAMMIIGFGATGAALRSKRRKLAAA